MATVGRYQVETEIGKGAMGVVYRATDPNLRRRVALKIHSLPRGLSPRQEEEYRERFLREAQAAAVLSHPGIVAVYDADVDSGTGLPFIAMEYVDGPSLRQVLDQEGRLEPDRVRALGGELAGALDAAHAAGIIHRDVKPANILLGKADGTAKIADFGVARMATSELTSSGTSLGSPAYMSPEQVTGRRVDGRSDLFSLAVVLYEALCGARPFGGEDTAALAYSVVHETPIPITRRAEGLPRGLDAFFDRALAKEPAERFASGQAFRQALEQAFHEEAANDVESTVVEGCAAVPPRQLAESRPRRRLLVTLALLLMLVGAGWAIFGGDRRAHLRLDAKSSVEAGELTLRVDGEKVYSRALSAPRVRKGLVKKLLDQNHENFEAWIKIAPGKHEISAQVELQDEEYLLRDTVVVDLEPGETRRLRLTVGRAFGSALKLKSD
jgi:predicted Ser/Thr protein kinase